MSDDTHLIVHADDYFLRALRYCCKEVKKIEWTKDLKTEKRGEGRSKVMLSLRKPHDYLISVMIHVKGGKTLPRSMHINHDQLG